MNKIEVGKKYRVTFPCDESDNVIEITKIDGDYAHYKTLVGVNKTQDFFGLKSDFGKDLIPYDEDENTKFKVGDRVKAIKGYNGKNSIIGESGTVIGIKGYVYSVEFDNWIGGHDGLGYGRGRKGYCWNCVEDTLRHIDEKIVITTDGKTTTAKMYDGKKLVKSAKADCHPDDEFDFEKGAGIAISRLLDWTFVPVEDTLEEEQFYTGKAVCVANTCRYLSFTVGKVYQIENGEFKTDSGSYITGVKSVKDFNDSFKHDGVEFLEIVE